MIDNHIHIGQFHEIYYDPVEIIQIVMEKCTDGLCFSSTTTCSEDTLYSEVETEITHTLAHIDWLPETARPFLWFIPAYAKQGVTVKKAMSNLPYKGIKLHPLAHQWDISDTMIKNLLIEIFEYAKQNKLPVLIHTGHSGVDAANTFSAFFGMYPEVNFILAHCRPLAEAVFLMRDYCNVYGDTAFLDERDLKQIIQEGLSYKVILGSDFPITNYFNNKFLLKKKELSLIEQYNNDFEQLQYYFYHYLLSQGGRICASSST